MTYEVVVIGAGPAGLSAAAALGARGISTLVIERARLPLDKACGEGIMPSGVRDLALLGLPLALLAAHGRRFHGIRYLSSGGHRAEAPFLEGPGVGLRRLELSQLLLQRVQELPSVRFVHGVRAQLREEWHDGQARFAVQLEGSLLTPRLIIGADGLNSQLRRKARMVTRSPEPQRWGLRQHFEIAPWSDHVEVYFDDGVEAYVTPVGDELVNVALLFDRQRLPEESSGRLLSQLLARFPKLLRRLEGAPQAGKPRAAGPLYQWPKKPYAAGLVLIGDAAGYVDPLTGEGVGIAARQALLLAELIGPLLAVPSEKPIKSRDLAPFVEAARSAAHSSQRLTRMLLWLGRHPRLLERTLAALSTDRALFQHLLSANQGERSLWRLPSGSARPLVKKLAFGAGPGPERVFESSHDALRHTS